MLEPFDVDALRESKLFVTAEEGVRSLHTIFEALVPSSPNRANTSPQKLNASKDVHFFSVGSLGGRTLLDSDFRVLEPVVGKINERTKAPVSLSSRLGWRQPRSEWFRVYRDFFLPSESYDLILKARIAILCTKSFEIMDLSDFKSVTIPQRDDPRHEKLAKRCESCRPMGMFRSSENEFLLCYDGFGLYVNRHGDPSRTKGTIEWEGTAEHVAWHPPHILIFDSLHRSSNGSLEEAPSQEARVHGVMRAEDVPQGRPGSGGPARGTGQHIFELIPTVPLFLPERLASPTQHSSFLHPTLNGPP
ncbi:CNH domain-containing protein [Lactifluus volemus]|nr:CNH domain-containing protein [Lactifluus volemus]